MSYEVALFPVSFPSDVSGVRVWPRKGGEHNLISQRRWEREVCERQKHLSWASPWGSENPRNAARKKKTTKPHPRCTKKNLFSTQPEFFLKLNDLPLHSNSPFLTKSLSPISIHSIFNSLSVAAPLIRIPFSPSHGLPPPLPDTQRPLFSFFGKSDPPLPFPPPFSTPIPFREEEEARPTEPPRRPLFSLSQLCFPT